MKEEFKMNIIGIAACTAGVAHTYVAKEKLINAAEDAGHSIHIETQGSIGKDNEIPEELIKQADVVIIAADIKVSGKERFEGIKTVEVPTDVVIKSPHKFIKKIEQIVAEGGDESE